MGLFDKKQCAICGEDIGLLGNRKLADGNMCSKCAAKLSPFFSERKQSTIEEIKQQLAYRENNRAELEHFTPTRVLNSGMKIYFDDNTRRFIVTRATDYKKDNPDLINASQVLSADYTVNERKTEIYKDDEQKTSFEPKRYKSEYTFNMKLTVDHPYFDVISFEVVDGPKPTSNISADYKNHELLCNTIQNTLRPDLYPLVVSTNNLNSQPQTVAAGAELAENASGTALNAGEWKCECGTINTSKFCGNCGKEKPGKWFCPNCGKENNSKFCVGCGTPKPETLDKPTSGKGSMNL